MSYFNRLEDIDLSLNKLSLLTRELFELPDLVSLNISENELKNFPKILNWGHSLRLLNLSGNKFSNLEKSFDKANLTKLDLSKNLLKEVPPSVRNINNLENLDLRGNVEISSLPDFLRNNISLKEVFGSNKVKFC